MPTAPTPTPPTGLFTTMDRLAKAHPGRSGIAMALSLLGTGAYTALWIADRLGDEVSEVVAVEAAAVREDVSAVESKVEGVDHKVVVLATQVDGLTVKVDSLESAFVTMEASVARERAARESLERRMADMERERGGRIRLDRGAP